MSVYGACCKFIVWCVVVLLVFAIVLNICLCNKSVEIEYIRFIDTHVAVYAPLARHLLYAISTLHTASTYGLLFVAPIFNPRLVSATGSHSGPGLMIIPDIPNGKPWKSNLVRVSHASIKNVTYNPHLKRPADMFVTCDTTKAPGGYFADGVLPTLLQMNTHDSRRLAHRDLLVATLDAIKEHPKHVPEFRAPAYISVEDIIIDVRRFNMFPFTALVLDKVQDVFALNFFRHLFGVDLSKKEIQQLKEWTNVNAPVLANMGTVSGGKRSAELAKVLEDRMSQTAIGQNLIKEAERRGMEGPARLRKTLFEFVFAGFGGNAPGGGLAVFWVMKWIQSNPDGMVPLYRKDPDAFLLEVMRLRGGGGAGLNPFVLEETVTHELPTGLHVTETAGEFGASMMVHGNHDPEVFGGPSKSNEYAEAFMPGRSNADRLLNFVSELRDIRKCPNMTGCDAAPRFCMGVHLVFRLEKQIMNWYVDGLERMQKTVRHEV